MNFKNILYEKRNGAAIIEFNRPEKKNAIELCKKHYARAEGLKAQLEQTENENRRLKLKLKKITRKKRCKK